MGAVLEPEARQKERGRSSHPGQLGFLMWPRALFFFFFFFPWVSPVCWWTMTDYSRACFQGIVNIKGSGVRELTVAYIRVWHSSVGMWLRKSEKGAENLPDRKPWYTQKFPTISHHQWWGPKCWPTSSWSGWKSKRRQGNPGQVQLWPYLGILL